MSQYKPQFYIGKMELLLLKQRIGENYLQVISEIASGFYRHAKAEIQKRNARGKDWGTISKTYRLDCGLTVRMGSYMYRTELRGVALSLKGLGGNFTFDLERFVCGAERFLFEKNILDATMAEDDSE